jgi:hypothetical protein
LLVRTAAEFAKDLGKNIRETVAALHFVFEVRVLSEYLNEDPGV